MSRPKISVIIASKVGAPFIDDCIQSLISQENAPPYEIIVVDCHGEETRKRITARFPSIHVIVQDPPASVPDLRRTGVKAASGEIIAILEEHCLASKDWMTAIASAHDGACAAVGGSVLDCNYNRLRDWITYFTEYNAYMPPVPSGQVSSLPGNNIAFKQEVLQKHLAKLTQGYWEAYLYSKLYEEKAVLLSDPKMAVYHRGPFDYGYYLYQRFLFSRAFAGARRTVMPVSRRLIYALVSPALPVLLLARMATRVWQKKCHVGKFVQSIPLLIPVTIVYVLGELIGYLFGPGDSLLKVE